MDRHNEVEQDTDPVASRAGVATRKGAQAFARLLQLAEQLSSGQIVRVVGFIAATYNGDAFKLDPFELRAVDIAISDDMLLCLDALRWARAVMVAGWFAHRKSIRSVVRSYAEVPFPR